MANHKTGAQRHNDKMDKIFSYYKEHNVSSKDGKSTYDNRYYEENNKGQVVKLQGDKRKMAGKMRRTYK